MPVAFIALAILTIITAVKGNYAQVGQQLNVTLFGQNGQAGFLQWAGALVGIAVIFRVIQAPTAGRAFIALLLLVYFYEHTSVISQIEQAMQSTSTAAQSASAGGSSAPTASSGTSATSAQGNALTPSGASIWSPQWPSLNNIMNSLQQPGALTGLPFLP